MTRQLFTASDIRHVVHDLKSTLLAVGADDLITPEAADVARELGVQIIRSPSTGGANPLQSSAPSSPFPKSLPPLKVVKGAGVSLESFGNEFAAPGTNVRLKDVVTSGDGSPMATGYMALDKGEFAWTLSYDEVDVVLEGELVITRGGEAVHGFPGDCIFIPKGSSITFGTPNHTRFVYIAFPADWNKQ